MWAIVDTIVENTLRTIQEQEIDKFVPSHTICQTLKIWNDFIWFDYKDTIKTVEYEDEEPKTVPLDFYASSKYINLLE